jgi:hypothetical protein
MWTTRTSRLNALRGLVVIAIAALCIPTRADVVTEWNVIAGELITAAGLGTPPANRVMAIAHTAAYEAANAITKRFARDEDGFEAAPGASVSRPT